MMTEEQIEKLAKIYKKDYHTAAIVAEICDEVLDRSGALLGEVRNIVRKEKEKENRQIL